MKVLVLNGSPRENGNTSLAINEFSKQLKLNGIDSEIINVGKENIVGCKDCGFCNKNNKCAINDIVNKIADKFEKAEGLVVASPVYYASANATLVACLQRLFCSTDFDKTMKVGASIAVCRRGGASSTFDELNKFFTISQMPVVSSIYWNSVHGMNEGEAKGDKEGLQTMQVLANNMAFLIKSIKLGKDKMGLPKKIKRTPTNFIK